MDATTRKVLECDGQGNLPELRSVRGPYTDETIRFVQSSIG